MAILGLVVLLSIVVLANAGLQERRAREATYMLIGVVNGGLALFGVWMLTFASQPLPEILSALPFFEMLGRAADDVGWVMLGTAVLASLLLVTPCRRGLACGLKQLRIGDLDPNSPVHTAALVLSLYLLAGVMIQWMAAGSIDELAELAGPATVGDALLSGVLTVVFALVGVGLGPRRTWAETLERLGLARPNLYNMLAGVGGASTMLLFFLGASMLWYVFARQSLEEVGSAADVLFGGFRSLPTALVASVSVAMGEELLFRGALQPRFGLLPTAVLFAVLHVQYMLSPALLIVLVIGLGLGLLRQWHDTTSCIVAHFGYDFVLLVLAAIAPAG